MAEGEERLGNINLTHGKRDQREGLRPAELAARTEHLLALGFDSNFVGSLLQAGTLPFVDRIDSYIAALQQRNFRDPVKVISRDPAVLRFSVETIDKKILNFRTCGFQNPVEMISTSPKILHLSDETIRLKITGIGNLGFRDTIKLIEANPNLLGRTTDNLEGKMRALKAMGFKNPVKMIMRKPQIADYDEDTIRQKLSHLQERGLKEVKITELMPKILTFGSTGIDEKLVGLKARGFANPEAVINRWPQLLVYSLDAVDEKLTGLKESGFNDPVRFITKNGSVVGMSMESIKRKLEMMQKQGFNAVEIYETNPTSLNLSQQTLSRKISDLRDRGFDPKKIISKDPGILTFSIKNIDRKLSFIKKVVSLYKLGTTAQEIMTHTLPLFRAKFERIVLLARVIREFGERNITAAQVTKLVWSRLDSVLLAFAERRPAESLDHMISRISDVNKRKISKFDAQTLLREHQQEFQKIWDVYDQAYVNPQSKESPENQG